jgi:hypothetical protein
MLNQVPDYKQHGQISAMVRRAVIVAIVMALAMFAAINGDMSWMP